MALAGDPRATDPVCVRSPLHGALAAMAEGFAGADDALVWRRFAEPVPEPAE
jgi:pyrroloquinoline quinone biosynthesis protein E